MKFNKEDEASFFKILLDDSEYLRLPSAFAKKYMEKGDYKKQNIILQTESGVKWKAEYVRIEERYYFTGGWLKFLKENHLQLGDFLVFWLRSNDPNPVFHVFIYSPTGCLKSKTSCSSRKQNKLDDTAAGTSKKPSFEVDQVISDDESLEEVPSLTKRVIKKPSIPRMRKRNQKLRFSESMKPAKQANVSSESEEENPSGEEGVTLWRNIKKCYLPQMPLSMGFLKATGMSRYNKLRLENKDGKSWDVTLRGLNRAPHIGVGWSDFARHNRVEVGSKCSFTHVKDNLLRVCVLRKKDRKRKRKRKTLQQETN